MSAGPDLHIYLLIHNIDGSMLRGEKTQSALGHLASLPNMHLVASIDHINAPLGVWSVCVRLCLLVCVGSTSTTFYSEDQSPSMYCFIQIQNSKLYL